MPIETMTLQDVSIAFCDRCNVEQGLVSGFILLPVMKKHSSSLKEAGWVERDEGVVCASCVTEEPENDTSVGLDAIAEAIDEEEG